jgi:hypothetical protein
MQHTTYNICVFYTQTYSPALRVRRVAIKPNSNSVFLTYLHTTYVSFTHTYSPAQRVRRVALRLRGGHADTIAGRCMLICTIKPIPIRRIKPNSNSM